jgi:glycine cleavage system H protein
VSKIQDNLRYNDSHEWVSVEDGVATVGISDHAQELLGELVFVELPEVGADLAKGDEAAVVESVKAASDVYSPVSGEVVEVNEDLESSPNLVNDEPYSEGWIFKIKLSNEAEVDDLMDSKAYASSLEDE